MVSTVCGRESVSPKWMNVKGNSLIFTTGLGLNLLGARFFLQAFNLLPFHIFMKLKIYFHGFLQSFTYNLVYLSVIYEI